ncbi:hypothetical protein DDF62_02080 [Caulobacter radicis]|uniref:hypothetical protein n=1 Tax=Caulobacter radicis TaxID=2172650 RepID=UPI000D5691D0|nr:hypothetical protein [Caulobacter radicis]PVM92811.1 hypothetical protein DDF62_02080 [Caulobacter radicis]
MSVPKLELSGLLSRCTFSDGQAEIRLAPFEMSQDELPIWSLVFSEPSFDAGAVEPSLDSEVEIEVFDGRAMIRDIFRGAEQLLVGSELKVTRVSYDVTDLRLHVRTLEDSSKYYSAELRAATAKDMQGRGILRELLRRAEIKAAASDHHRERQAAAINVLKRLQAHFGE